MLKSSAECIGHEQSSISRLETAHRENNLGSEGDIIEQLPTPQLCVAQLNTKDILFICGGAFVSLDRLVAERTSTASLGFGNPVRHIAPAFCGSHTAALCSCLM